MSLYPGSPAPWFSALSPVNPQFAFNSLGGRYILLAFLPPPGSERAAALQLIEHHREQFQDERIAFFGVLPDSPSFQSARNVPPFRWFADFNGELRRLFNAVGSNGEVLPQWVLIDPSLRVICSVPLQQGSDLMARIARLPDPADHAGVPMHAPVLIVPRIFEPRLCRQLIDLYHAAGGRPSGVMREQNGKTVGVFDNFKNRNDADIEDEALKAELTTRICRRLLPEIEKAFQFRATRIERYIVACYDAMQGGYFRAHRDNTTAGTVHRKFAVSINLNAEEFAGGDLRFAEFGPRTYRPPTGGAVVFSCSLLHEATPVTRGIRYAFLPFLYDETGAAARQANLHTLLRDPAETTPTAGK